MALQPVRGTRFLSDSVDKVADSEPKPEKSEAKSKRKGKNIFEVLAYLDYYGVGWRYSTMVLNVSFLVERTENLLTGCPGILGFENTQTHIGSSLGLR